MELLTLRLTRGGVLFGAVVLVITALLNTAPQAMVNTAPRTAVARLDAGNGSDRFDVPKTGYLVTPADCWVSGDLVGDGNPTQVYADLCSPSAAPQAEAL